LTMFVNASICYVIGAAGFDKLLMQILVMDC